ncbi:hypothetical protein TNCV_840841 [Trichonephila clavipes]|nr:hypothetical protein TNCV_840841 [Trichonephila clavipes]
MVQSGTQLAAMIMIVDSGNGDVGRGGYRVELLLSLHVSRNERKSQLMDKEVTQIIAQTALMFNCYHNISSVAQLFKTSPEAPKELEKELEDVEVAEAVFDSFGVI